MECWIIYENDKQGDILQCGSYVLTHTQTSKFGNKDSDLWKLK